MAWFAKRREAIKLRKRGKTYTYIRACLGVSKSTLSYWIRDVELTPEQREKINKNTKAKQIEAYIKTTRERRKQIIQNYYNEAQRELGPLSTRDFLTAGLFLYLGEGSKSDYSQVCISNSDPSIIRFTIFWFTKILGIKKEDIRVALHLYKDMDIEQELKFWRQITGIAKKQFWKPYIKKTFSQKINHPTFGHGTCKIYYGSAKLKNEVMAKIRVILDGSIKI